MLLAGCDTGDGKDLQAFDPADYPSPVVDTTIAEFDELGDLDDGGQFGVDELVGGEAGSVDLEPLSIVAPWVDGGVIDIVNTCDGDDLSPALSWGGVPAGTAEIAITMVDDSALNQGQPFVHWAIGGLDPNEIALVEGDVPPGALQGLNFFGDVGYGGPCPPPGDDPHTYRITVYALAQQLEVQDGAPAAEFIDMVNATAFASADVTGSFQR